MGGSSFVETQKHSYDLSRENIELLNIGSYDPMIINIIN